MTSKELGKIQSVKFGIGGYDDCMIGLTIGLGGQGWGTSDFWGYWNTKVEERCKWSDGDRYEELGKMVMHINTILREAKCHDIKDLEGKPVEVCFEDSALKSWRILTEVL